MQRKSSKLRAVYTARCQRYFTRIADASDAGCVGFLKFRFFIGQRLFHGKYNAHFIHFDIYEVILGFNICVNWFHGANIESSEDWSKTAYY